MPPTVRDTVIRDIGSAPCQRSIASVRARRTLASSNGFRAWFGVTSAPQFQSLSCTVSLVAQSRDKLVARGGRKAAKLNRRPIGFYSGDPDRLLVREDADEPVQIGQSRPVVIGVAHAGDRLSRLVVLEAERPRAHDVLLEPARVAVEDLLLVDEGVWIGERRQKRRRRELEVKDDRLGIGRLDRIDHRIVAATHADHAFRRIDDLVPACRHVVCGHDGAVLEPDIAADLERVAAAPIRRLGNLDADIANEFGGVSGVLRVCPDQHAVERCHRVNGREGVLAMAVEARRRVPPGS